MKRLIFTLLFLCLAFPAMGQMRFKTPYTILEKPPVTNSYAPTLNGDQTELFFETSGDIYRATRTTTALPFVKGARVAELSTTQFTEERPFLSGDALRIYFSRRANTSFSPEIYMASRPGLNAPFGNLTPLGPQARTLFKGRFGSVSEDEKTIYLESYTMTSTGTPVPSQSDITIATRETLATKFGAWKSLPNINTVDFERGPFISRDAHMLLFSRIGSASQLPGTLFQSLRNDTDVPFPAGSPIPGLTSYYPSQDPFLVFPPSRIYFSHAGILKAADREIDAHYQLSQVPAAPGRTFLYPVKVYTTEKDALHFAFRLFFDSFYLRWDGSAVTPEYGGENFSVKLEGAGRLYVTMQANSPTTPDGLPHTVLYLRFYCSSSAISGLSRTMRMSAPLINGISVERPADGSAVIQPKPPRAAISQIRIR